MNFTREPIIETVITPREGMKLLVRSSKGQAQEEYFVDAVEVVSFGHSFFFRSLERPKSFLLPMGDYEVLELKETKVSLKNAAPERAIKIGGGREVRPPREPQMEEREQMAESPALEQRSEPRSSDRKRDKRRRGRRGGSRHEQSMHPEMREPLSEDVSVASMEPLTSESHGEEVKAPSFISKLFPPPPTLIKETLSRYKPAEPLPAEEVASTDEDFAEELFDVPSDPKADTPDEETPLEE